MLSLFVLPADATRLPAAMEAARELAELSDKPVERGRLHRPLFNGSFYVTDERRLSF